uniref:Retrovirus-related Pol polyprotein from transposon TNT 1-94 n=1 Tax=Macrostomum lignano TaxID=282301 RepID=A0A1I8JLH4_9PLAT
MGAEVEAEAEAEIEAEFVADDRSTIPKSPPTISSFNFGSGFLRKLEEQIQAGVSFELESPRGIKFLSLYALRELTMRKNELKALENSLTKQITAMRTEVQSVLRFLEPVGADIPTDNSEPSFWPINSWEKYVQFASNPNEHISTLKSLLRSCKRDKWSDALMAMLNESLSKEMQAVINLIGSDMRSRAVAAGVATNLADAQLGFQSTLLSHFQKAITFIYGATAEAGRPSEQSVRNTCRQQLKHGGDRLKGRSHRTGSQLLSGVQTQSPASDSTVQDSLWWQRLQAPLLAQRQRLKTKTSDSAAPCKDSLWWQRLQAPLLAAPCKDSLWWQRLKPASGSAVQRQSWSTQSPASGSAVQRQSLVAATPSPASGSAVQRQSLVAATPSPASGSAVQRQSLVAATPSPLLAAPCKDSLWWQRLKVPLLAAPCKDSLWWQRLQARASGSAVQRQSWWQRLKVPLLAAPCKDVSGGSDSKAPLLAAPQRQAQRQRRVSGGSDSKSRLAAPAKTRQRRAKTQPFIFFFPNTIATISGRSAASGDSKAELPIQKASEYSVGFSASKAEQPSPPFSKVKNQLPH